MSHDYNYRPKFVDIRVRKPPSTDAKPAGPVCQHPGCNKPGVARAPKSRDDTELWLFCEAHAKMYMGQFGRSDGMTEAEAEAYQKTKAKQAGSGQRKTWDFRTSGIRSTGAAAYKAATGEEYEDPFALFRGRPRRGAGPSAAPTETLNRPPVHVRQALEDMGLPEGADKSAVRETYRELVRKFHPDSNGGDRSAEARLQVVVKAYKVLKTARRA